MSVTFAGIAIEVSADALAKALDPMLDSWLPEAKVTLASDEGVGGSVKGIANALSPIETTLAGIAMVVNAVVL